MKNIDRFRFPSDMGNEFVTVPDDALHYVATDEDGKEHTLDIVLSHSQRGDEGYHIGSDAPMGSELFPTNTVTTIIIDGIFCGKFGSTMTPGESGYNELFFAKRAAEAARLKLVTTNK